jgi:putative aldouronate transport system substrate-binding protein
MKRFLVLFIAALMLVSIATGCAEDTGNGESTTATTKEAVNSITFPLAEPIHVKFVCQEHIYLGHMDTDNNPAVKWFTERTNIIMDFEQVPFDAYEVRVNLLLSSNEIPDLLQLSAPIDLNKPEHQALFANFLDHKELLPNFMAFLDANPDYKDYAADLLSAPGKLFGYPSFIVENKLGNMNSMTYRKDIFDKYNLKSDTWEELYDSMVILKEKYPDSYPLGSFDVSPFIDTFAKGFRSGFDTNGIYFNLDTKKYEFGPYEDNFKEAITWLAKCNAAGLLHPDALSTTWDMLQVQLTNDQVFVWANLWPCGNWLWAAAFGDRLAKQYQEGPRMAEFVDGDPGVIITPFRVPANSDGVRGWSKFRTGWMAYVGISAKSDYVKELIAMYDLSYSDPEFNYSMSMGPIGEAWYFDGKGEAKYTPTIKTPYNPEGTLTVAEYWDAKGVKFFSYPYFDVMGDHETFTLVGGDLDFNTQDTRKNTAYPFYEDGSGYFGPMSKVILSDEDAETVGNKGTTLGTYVNETLVKFIMGDKPMNEWDSFIEKCKSYGSDDLLKIYNDNFVFFTSKDLLLD